MADLIQLRKDTEANWIEADPILAQGEHAITLDNLDTEPKFKIGDGIHLWSELPYFGGGSGGGDGCCPEVVRFDLMDYNNIEVKFAEIDINENENISGKISGKILAIKDDKKITANAKRIAPPIDVRYKWRESIKVTYPHHGA